MRADGSEFPLLADCVAKLMGGHIRRNDKIGSPDEQIEVALRHSTKNQCCAIEPAKYFCNTIGTSREWCLSRLAAAHGCKPDSDKPSIGMFMNSRPSASWAGSRLSDLRFPLEAAAHADQVLEDGDPVAAVNWHRILDTIERLQVKAPAEGEKVHPAQSTDEEAQAWVPSSAPKRSNVSSRCSLPLLFLLS